MNKERNKVKSNSVILEHELNLRSILVVYMIGPGDGDVCKLMTIKGVSDRSSFEGQFNRSGEFEYITIIERWNSIAQESLREEILLTH